jgi:hypothetical protein
MDKSGQLHALATVTSAPTWWTHSQTQHFGKEKNILSLLEIKPQFLDWPALYIYYNKGNILGPMLHINVQNRVY